MGNVGATLAVALLAALAPLVVALFAITLAE